ncbi:MAG: hypothetical protein ACLFO2_03720 [Candidatus Woesearchaeota archaeon]
MAAIVVSIAGTTISLNKLETMREGPTGYATYDEGNVSLTVSDSLSIVLENDRDLLNFGSCQPPEDGIVIDSDADWGGAKHDGACGGYSDEGFLQLRNNGNMDANVTMNVTDAGEAHGGTFLESNDALGSWIAYKIANNTDHPGCVSGAATNYTNITNADRQDLPACDNLQAAGNDHSMNLYAKVYLPQTTHIGQDDLQITFWAQEAS